jgi:hypothetical protein
VRELELLGRKKENHKEPSSEANARYRFVIFISSLPDNPPNSRFKFNAFGLFEPGRGVFEIRGNEEWRT